MGEREDNVYKAKLAEQAERYDGKIWQRWTLQELCDIIVFFLARNGQSHERRGLLGRRVDGGGAQSLVRSLQKCHWSSQSVLENHILDWAEGRKQGSRGQVEDDQGLPWTGMSHCFFPFKLLCDMLWKNHAWSFPFRLDCWFSLRRCRFFMMRAVLFFFYFQLFF